MFEIKSDKGYFDIFMSSKIPVKLDNFKDK